jgi:hypothetical protein
MTPARGADGAPAKALAGFIAKFDPAIARLMRSARVILRKRFPTAVELVYDNYNALAIGFGPTERASDAFVSLAAYARGVSLYFIHGAKLPDPEKRLQGAGNQGRFIRLETLAPLDDPYVVWLLRTAAEHAKSPLAATGRGYTVIKSVSAKQRPRRPEAREEAQPVRGNSKMNARWHAAHPVPKKASLDERVQWHVAHAAHCACRDIPATVAAELRRRRRARRA